MISTPFISSPVTLRGGLRRSAAPSRGVALGTVVAVGGASHRYLRWRAADSPSIISAASSRQALPPVSRSKDRGACRFTRPIAVSPAPTCGCYRLRSGLTLWANPAVEGTCAKSRAAPSLSR
nr:hypothetical protein [uncultured bacterium]